MNTKFLKLKYLFLFSPFFVMGMSCSHNIIPKDSTLEISPQSPKSYIDQTFDGVTFKFCLLNEQGQESTVFNEGENFSFYFSIHNGTNDSIVVSNFITDDFFRVTKLNPTFDMGKPWTGSWCNYSLAPHEFPINSGDTQELSCEWIILTTPTYPICGDIDMKKEPLPKGDYETVINQDFHYMKNGKSFTISNVKFIINFKIQ